MKLSVVFSFRNEEAVLEELIRRTTDVLKRTGMDYELIFVNDDSADRSLAVLLKAREQHPQIKILTTSRRFGVHPCLVAGLRHTDGDAVVYFDADLQDPPELIPELIGKWQVGADVVNTVRTKRLGENPIRMWLTKKAYQIINALSEIDLPVNMGDYKLLSRKVVDQVLAIDEYDPYLRGITRWVGFRQETVYYTRDARHAGKTHFPLLGTAPAKEFIKGLASFSVAPIYLVLLYGLSVSALSALTILVAVTARLFGAGIPLWPVFAAILAFLGGNILAAIGLIGLYLGRTYNQVKNRPLYIVREKIGFNDSDVAIGDKS